MREMVNMKQLPFYFDEDTVFWEILEKTELLQDDVSMALLAYAYTIRRSEDRDEIWQKLNEAYRARAR
jgi:hypothetical protein